MMKQKHEHLTAYVIHTRPFRETSLLIEFFSQELGRCSGVARGVYRGKSPLRQLCQLFTCVSVSLQGSGTLLSLTHAERFGKVLQQLSGTALICGLYLNELIYYTLHTYDPHPALFQAYDHALYALAVTSANPAIVLREFECILLEELGYGINFDMVEEAGQDYLYHGLHGFQKMTHPDQSKKTICFSGALLQKIAARMWDDPQVLRVAKQLTRIALAPVLAGKEIRSRELLG